MALGVRNDILGLVGNRICRWTRTPYCFGYACVEVEERMNRDDIILMAREAFGAPYSSYLEKRSWDINDKQVERFATLVAAAEREACAKVCETAQVASNWNTREALAATIRARGKE